MTQNATPNLALDYLMPEQAQKHVTLNDGLRRLDALVHLSVGSATRTQPPATPQNGARFLVAADPAGAWADHAGEIAIYEDTGWQFVAPMPGWRLWEEDTKSLKVFDGACWVSPGQPELSGVSIARAEFVTDFSDPAPVQPAIDTHRLLLGVTARVLEELSGTTSWDLGVAADEKKFANGVSAARDSIVTGLANPPEAIWAQTPLVVTPRGGPIVGGRIAFAIFTLVLPVPDSS